MTTKTPYKHLPPVFLWSFFKPRYWSTWLLLALLRSIALLPLNVNQWLGRGLGGLLYRLVPSRRRIAATNIAACFPEFDAAAQAKMVRDVVESCGLGITETAVALWGSDKRLRNCFSITGLEYLEAVQAKGKGVLLVGCHMTTLDICGRMFAFHVQVDTLYRQDPNPLMAYMIVKARERSFGESIISVETRKVVRNLRKGHVVWYAPDQDYGIEHGIFAPFFGVPAATVTGTGRFARLGDAEVISYAHYRDADGRYRIELGSPLTNFPSGNDLADCTRINQVLEEIIRKEPEQYLWVHRRFKNRPEGEPNFYPKRKKARN